MWPITPSYEQAVAELTSEAGDFTLVSETVRGIGYKVFRDMAKTLPEIYAQARADHGPKDFLVFEESRLTYSETYDRAAAVARQLIDRFGVCKGDRVAIGMRNFPEWVIAFMAITSIGAISVSLNAWWTGEELEYGLSDSGARLAFFDQERYERVASRLARLGVESIAVRWQGDLPASVADFDDLWRSVTDPSMPEVDLSTDDDVTILFTSGTTGFPKGAVSTHRGVLSGITSWAFYGALRIKMGLLPEPEENPEFQPAILMPLPLFHVSGSAMLVSASSGSARSS